jgi:hypothetical protein
MGYSYFEDTKDEHRKSVVEQMTKEAYKNNRLWFGSETSPYERYQTEDLGDNAMRASGME